MSNHMVDRALCHIVQNIERKLIAWGDSHKNKEGSLTIGRVMIPMKIRMRRLIEEQMIERREVQPRKLQLGMIDHMTGTYPRP